MKRFNRIALCSIVVLLLLNIPAIATEAYPSNWFVNMKYNKVQVFLQ